MGALVTFPREKHARGKQMRTSDVKTAQDQMILTRVRRENVARWIDSDEDVLAGMDVGGKPSPRLSDEECEELATAGAGSWGHCTVIEPADLDLYESYMHAPLRMPEKPGVMVSYWDINRGPAPFMEGRVTVSPVARYFLPCPLNSCRLSQSAQVRRPPLFSSVRSMRG